MTSIDPVLAARGRLARLHHRGGSPDPVAVSDAKRNLTAAHVERAIRNALDAEVPLSAEQRARLAALLAGDGPDGPTYVYGDGGAYVLYRGDYRSAHVHIFDGKPADVPPLPSSVVAALDAGDDR